MVREEVIEILGLVNPTAPVPPMLVEQIAENLNLDDNAFLDLGKISSVLIIMITIIGTLGDIEDSKDLLPILYSIIAKKLSAKMSVEKLLKGD